MIDLLDNKRGAKLIPCKDFDGELPDCTIEYQAMLRSLEKHQPREAVKTEILNAYNDPNWNWDIESDGCTIVNEEGSEPYRFPPCVAHDHLCVLAGADDKKRAYADRILLWGHLDYDGGIVDSYARWIGVRAYWFGMGRWLAKFKNWLRR